MRLNKHTLYLFIYPVFLPFFFHYRYLSIRRYSDLNYQQVPTWVAGPFPFLNAG
jgi:hypothetical protein